MAGLRQQGRQGIGRQALEHAEVGHRQRGALKVAQQPQPGLALPQGLALALGLLSLLGVCLGLCLGMLGLRLGPLLGLGLLIALAAQLAAARQLIAGELAVLLAQLSGGLAVQVKAVAGLAQRDQIAGAAGVAAEKG